MRSSMRCAAPTALLQATIGIFLLAAAGPAGADPASTDRRVDVRAQVNDCNGETVALAGSAHYTLKPHPDGTSTTHVHLHLEGVGDQGNPYVFNIIRHSFWRAGGGFEDRVDSHGVLVSKGSSPNEVSTFHFDRAAGEFDFDVDCTG